MSKPDNINHPSHYTQGGIECIQDRKTKKKLSDSDVLQIRVLYATGDYSMKDLGKVFSISPTQIFKIVNGRQWKNLTNGDAVKKPKERTTKIAFDELDGEEWAVIQNHTGYEVSNFGRVRNKNSYRIRKPIKTKNGYLTIMFSDHKKYTLEYLHRLVAFAFLPTQEGKNVVNHIDGDRENNYAENLEWCTQAENVAHAANTLKTMRQYEKACQRQSKPVLCYGIDSGMLIASYPSIREAARQTGIASANIVAQLHGKTKRTKTFVWKYL